MSDTPFDPEAFTADARRNWTETADKYDALSARLFGPTADAFVEFAGVRKGARVLDVATGPGICARAAARRAGEKGSVLAVDLSPGMLERARLVPPAKRAAPIEWREMDAQALDLPPASFDAALCQLGLMLFAKPAEALSGMARATKPGGTVACLVQGRRWAMKFTSLVMDAIVSRAKHLKAPPGAPTLYAFAEDGVLETAFMKAGLGEIVTKRLSGDFLFESPEAYWTAMTEASGRTGAMLRSLTPEVQAKIRADVVRRAGMKRVGRRVAIPYEFVMARGSVPSRR